LSWSGTITRNHLWGCKTATKTTKFNGTRLGSDRQKSHFLGWGDLRSATALFLFFYPPQARISHYMFSSSQKVSHPYHIK
jgi:hypothetical protein